MNDVTFMILKVIVSVATALITVYLIPYIKSQTKTKRQEEVLSMVEVAVRAAEQTLNSGKVKKAEVVTFVTSWLDQRGIKITEEQLDKLIESAVYSMNNETGVVINQTVETAAEQSE